MNCASLQEYCKSNAGDDVQLRKEPITREWCAPWIESPRAESQRHQIANKEYRLESTNQVINYSR